MLSLVALVFMSLATGMIIFQQINKGIVDVLDTFSGRFNDGQLKFAISALIISAPIFYYLMYLINKSLIKGDLDKDSAVRRWLTYFILLVAAVVMIGWLIGTLNSFLNGELTTKFLLKAITAIGISAGIFSFFLYDIKRDKVKHEKDAVINIFFYASLAVVIIVFVSALFIVESPTETRNRIIDDQILMNFDQIDSAINTYYQENSRLPDSLAALSEEFSYIRTEDLADPVTKENFGYNTKGEKSYELCANFRTSNMDRVINERYYSDRWPHETGEQCLGQKIYGNDDKRIVPAPVFE